MFLEDVFLQGAGIDTDPDRDAAVFIGGDAARRELVIVKPFASVRLRESFSGGTVFAGAMGGGLLLGFDGLLLRIDLEVL